MLLRRYHTKPEETEPKEVQQEPEETGPKEVKPNAAKRRNRKAEA